MNAACKTKRGPRVFRHGGLFLFIKNCLFFLFLLSFPLVDKKCQNNRVPSLSMVLKQVFLTAGDKGEDKVSAVFHFDATGGFTGFRTLHAYLMVLP